MLFTFAGDSESSVSLCSSDPKTEDEPVPNATNSDCNVEVAPEVPENPYQNLSNVLGMEPGGEGALGPPLNEQIWTRWSSYITKGADKEQVKDLCQIYPFPSNAELLQGPKVNPEVQALLTNEQRNTDNFLLKIQNTLGRGLTAVGQVLTGSLDKPERSEEAKTLADAAKLFADAMHCLTAHRKFSMSSKLSPSARKVAQECLPDKYLFGADFNDRCKSAKEIEKTSREIKIFDKPSTSSKYLNYKRQNYKNRKRETSKYPSNKPQPNSRHQIAPQDRTRRHRKY